MLCLFTAFPFLQPFNLILTLELDLSFSFCHSFSFVSCSLLLSFLALFPELVCFDIVSIIEELQSIPWIYFSCFWFSRYPCTFCFSVYGTVMETWAEQLLTASECQRFSNSSLLGTTLHLTLWSSIASVSSTGGSSFVLVTWDIRSPTNSALRNVIIYIHTRS